MLGGERNPGPVMAKQSKLPTQSSESDISRFGENVGLKFEIILIVFVHRREDVRALVYVALLPAVRLSAHSLEHACGLGGKREVMSLRKSLVNSF